MEKKPNHMCVSVKRGYNATHLRAKNILVKTLSDKAYTSGIVEHNTVYGNVVKTYDLEKTICQLFKNKNHTDLQVFQYAIKEYMKRTDKNIYNLIKYSVEMKIEKMVRNYLEVLM